MKAANDDVHVQERRAQEGEPLGPLWVITIGMGALFGIVGLAMAFG